jgi:hypothetical protein
MARLAKLSEGKGCRSSVIHFRGVVRTAFTVGATPDNDRETPNRIPATAPIQKTVEFFMWAR